MTRWVGGARGPDSEIAGCTECLLVGPARARARAPLVRGRQRDADVLAARLEQIGARLLGVEVVEVDVVVVVLVELGDGLAQAAVVAAAPRGPAVPRARVVAIRRAAT